MPPGLPGLKGARERAGLTQKVLAEKVSVTPEYISFLENGRSTPSLPLLYALATATSTTVDALLRPAPASSDAAEPPRREDAA